MSDLALQELRRKVAMGDPDAIDVLQIAECRAGIHCSVLSDEPAEDCGCPNDPGIHRCHPFVCAFCDVLLEA